MLAAGGLELLKLLYVLCTVLALCVCRVELAVRRLGGAAPAARQPATAPSTVRAKSKSYSLYYDKDRGLGESCLRVESRDLNTPQLITALYIH